MGKNNKKNYLRKYEGFMAEKGGMSVDFGCFLVIISMNEFEIEKNKEVYHGFHKS